MKTGAEQQTSALVAFALLLGGSAAAMFLAGRAPQGNLGIFLLCAGGALIGCPPILRVKPLIAGAATLFWLCSGLALLPAAYFPVPRWRQVLAAVPDLSLPETVSAAPWQTAFWLGVLAISVLLGIFLLTQPVRSRGLAALAVAACLICGAYTAASIVTRDPTGATLPSFGFFPNRNHTATLLITGSVLSAAGVCVGFRERKRWLANVGVATLLLCVIGLLYFSESRAGVLFLFVGIVGWLACLGRQLDRRLLIIVALTCFVGLGGFFVLGGAARNRMMKSFSHAEAPSSPTASTGPELSAAQGDSQHFEITADDRLRIYRDALSMARDFPLTGAGLGTFSLVFPPYRQTSANPNLVLHPESDWLMVVAETGWPALICLGTLLAIVLLSWKPSRSHPYWPLRAGLLMAAVAALLHGCFDVPVHRAALGWWVLALAGLALQPGRESGEASGGGRVARGVFIAGGVCAVMLGAMLVRAQWLGGPALPPFIANQAEDENVRALAQKGELPEATKLARRAVLKSPLAPALYYQLGLLLPSLGGHGARD